MAEKEQGGALVREVGDTEELAADIDVAVAEHLTMHKALAILSSPYTWLPALMYMTTFGFELAVDANLANVFYAGHSSTTFTQLNAGYYASAFGFYNFVTRPLGGILADVCNFLLTRQLRLIMVCECRESSKDTARKEKSSSQLALGSFKVLCRLRWAW